MNQDIKRRWVAALRSGEYEQGKRWLNDNGKLCCLGVLCELAVQDGVITKHTMRDGIGVYGIGATAVPPVAVEDWAGFGRSSTSVWKVKGDYLVAMNDEYGYSFAQIADAIEQHM